MAAAAQTTEIVEEHIETVAKAAQLLILAELVSLAALVAAEPLLAVPNPAGLGTRRQLPHRKEARAATVLRVVGNQRVVVVVALLLREQLLLSALVVLAVLVQLLALAAHP